MIEFRYEHLAGRDKREDRMRRKVVRVKEREEKQTKSQKCLVGVLGMLLGSCVYSGIFTN